VDRGGHRRAAWLRRRRRVTAPKMLAPWSGSWALNASNDRYGGITMKIKTRVRAGSAPEEG